MFPEVLSVVKFMVRAKLKELFKAKLMLMVPTF